MEISRATAGDFLAIAELDRQSWRRNRDAEFIPDGEHVWRIWVEHALVLCAKEADDLLGVALAFPCVDGRWCLHKIFVRETARGRGVGGRLLSEIAECLDNAGANAFLTVDPTNTRALELYKRAGFTECVFVKGFYRGNEDRYVLTRRAVG